MILLDILTKPLLVLFMVLELYWILKLQSLRMSRFKRYGFQGTPSKEELDAANYVVAFIIALLAVVALLIINNSVGG